MTGFGSAEERWETWSCQAEIRSVNHRFLDIHCRLPAGFQFLEQDCKKQIKAICSRGKIDCSIRLEIDSEEAKLRLNADRAQSISQLLSEFEAVTGRDVNVRIADLSGTKIFEENNSTDPPEECEKMIRDCLSIALEDLRSMKEREGDAMLNDIQQRLSSSKLILQSIENLSRDEPEQFRKRLQQRIAQLNTGKDLNPERLEQEVALLADKLDVSEEIIRFKTHLEQMDQIITQTEVGKKAEFLLQELNREVNTIASKSNNAVISQSAVEIKSELEKIREQLQNIQ
ncbi:MAG: hypothetical protein MAG581_01000 [Deltaproteobacteria bacterium]|nr:hypothetical protein [Deltaproteobacteria bacterium]